MSIPRIEMPHRENSNVTRRRLCATVGASIALAGCIGDTSKQSGSIVDRIEIINVDETPHRFQVTLLTAGNTQIFEETVTVDSAPRNEYTRTVLTDMPSTPAVKIAVATERRSTEKPISGNLDEAVFTVLCNPAGDIGITRFTDSLRDTRTHS